MFFINLYNDKIYINKLQYIFMFNINKIHKCKHAFIKYYDIINKLFMILLINYYHIINKLL